MPSPDVNAPSPSPDSDLDLPNDDDVSGIVECLEGGVDSDSDEDLMSIISYHSSDEENPKYSYFELLQMPDYLRRRYLPLPNPSFSDSDLTELEDSVEDIEEPRNSASEEFVRCPLSYQAHTRDQSKVSNQRHNNPLNFSIDSCSGDRFKTSSDICESYSAVNHTSNITSDSILFKEPAQKTFLSLSNKHHESVFKGNSPFVNDPLTLPCAGSHTVSSSGSETNPASCSTSLTDLNGSSERNNVPSDSASLDISADFLPTDEDLSGLLECLVENPVPDPVSPKIISTPLPESNVS